MFANLPVLGLFLDCAAGRLPAHLLSINRSTPCCLASQTKPDLSLTHLLREVAAASLLLSPAASVQHTLLA